MLVGCFVEEIVSPIPSFVVLIPAGAAAHVQDIGWWYLPILAFIGAVGRLLAAMILYFIADKGENWLFGEGRRIFGVTHKQMESFGQRFSGSNRDLAVLFALNAIPVLPTSLLSLACGFIKIDFRIFVIATYFGSAVNAIIYMSIGYAGFEVADSLRHLELAGQIVVGLLVVALFVWYVRFRRRRSH